MIVVVAELNMYGFWGLQGRIAELLRILETKFELARIGGEDLLPNWRDKFGYDAQ